jgi:phospholipase/carboxylesterase
MSDDHNPHMQPPAAHFGAALASARLVVILVHGRGQRPADLDETLVRRLDLPDLAYLAPAAADQTWYPGGFMLPTEQNQPRLGFALARLTALSDALAAGGRPVSNQVLMGFSQGACLVCEQAYRQGRRYGALIAFTGGLIGPPGLAWDADDAGALGEMSVLLGGSDADPWVPATRMQETAEVFRRLGASVEIELYPGMGHLIGDQQIAAARRLLVRLPDGRPLAR